MEPSDRANEPNPALVGLIMIVLGGGLCWAVFPKSDPAPVAPPWDRSVPPLVVSTYGAPGSAVAATAREPAPAVYATTTTLAAATQPEPQRTSEGFDMIANPTPAFSRAVAANDRCARAGNDQATCSARAVAQCDTRACIDGILIVVNMAQRFK